MAVSFFSDFGLMWYMNELTKKDLVKFKESLKEETAQLGLKQISWSEVKKASREGLASLLMKHYQEKQAWEVASIIFKKISRRDLCERASRESAGYTKIYQAHAKKKFKEIWSNIAFTIIPHVFNHRITQVEQDYVQNFFPSRETSPRSSTVILQGAPGIGKSMMLMKLILAWSEGSLYQNYHYIFYFCCRKVKQLGMASLAQLITMECPDTSVVPVEEILSQPEKLLFILDSFEELQCDLTEPEAELCDQWAEPLPVKMLLSSLLRKRMLPESSLIMIINSRGPQGVEERLESAKVRTITGFSENDRKLYFQSQFPDKNRALKALRLVQENEQIFAMCQVPLVCWMVANCLRQEMEKGNNPALLCRCATSLYVNYVLNLFIPRGGSRPSQVSQDQLKGLCILAIEGMWFDTVMFSKEAFQSIGLTERDIFILLDARILRKVLGVDDYYMFLHNSIQEFCAALFYFLKHHSDHPNPQVGGLRKLLSAFLMKKKPQWIFLGCFITGLLRDETREKLDMFFGYQLSQEVTREFLHCLQNLNEDEDLHKQVDFLLLFYCMYEARNDSLVSEAMDLLNDVHVTISSHVDLVILAYCLKYTTCLSSLSLSVQNVLQEETANLSKSEKFVHWNQICSVLTTNQHFQLLQVKDSKLDEQAFEILYNHLRHPSCSLQVLEINRVWFHSGKLLLFEVLLQNSNLTHLDLNHTILTHEDVKILCENLNQEACNIEKLLLADCRLLVHDCKLIAKVLTSNKKLKHLNLSCNQMDKGIYVLFTALCHPDCALEFLVLDGCDLSECCWDCLLNVLLINKTLIHLDIGNNNLRDEGLKVLCQALRRPDCGLTSLSIRNCFITKKGCQDLAEVLSNNGNLIRLQLSHNKVTDAGIKLLCEALRHPNCCLENLGLEACDLTSACCEDLASVFTHSHTLWGINLLNNVLDYRGVAMLLEALRQHKKRMQVLGLQIADFDEETQALLRAEEENNPNLAIISSL